MGSRLFVVGRSEEVGPVSRDNPSIPMNAFNNLQAVDSGVQSLVEGALQETGGCFGWLPAGCLGFICSLGCA